MTWNPAAKLLEAALSLASGVGVSLRRGTELPGSSCIIARDRTHNPLEHLGNDQFWSKARGTLLSKRVSAFIIVKYHHGSCVGFFPPPYLSLSLIRIVAIYLVYYKVLGTYQILDLFIQCVLTHMFITTSSEGGIIRNPFHRWANWGAGSLVFGANITELIEDMVTMWTWGLAPKFIPFLTTVLYCLRRRIVPYKGKV